MAVTLVAVNTMLSMAPLKMWQSIAIVAAVVKVAASRTEGDFVSC